MTRLLKGTSDLGSTHHRLSWEVRWQRCIHTTASRGRMLCDAKCHAATSVSITSIARAPRHVKKPRHALLHAWPSWPQHRLPRTTLACRQTIFRFMTCTDLVERLCIVGQAPLRPPAESPLVGPRAARPTGRHHAHSPQYRLSGACIGHWALRRPRPLVAICPIRRHTHAMYS